MTEEYFQQQITGMWIPGEIAFNPKLNSDDMRVWWMIETLNPYADTHYFCINNKYISEILNIDLLSIKKSITKLIKLKYFIKYPSIAVNGIKTKVIGINPEYFEIYKQYKTLNME